jgi:hypothetical protein
MTDTDAFTKPLTLLDILWMRNLKHTSTRKMIMLFLDLIHDFSHLEGTGVDRVVLRQESLEGFWRKVAVRASMGILRTGLISCEDLLAARVEFSIGAR